MDRDPKRDEFMRVILRELKQVRADIETVWVILLQMQRADGTVPLAAFKTEIEYALATLKWVNGGEPGGPVPGPSN